MDRAIGGRRAAGAIGALLAAGLAGPPAGCAPASATAEGPEFRIATRMPVAAAPGAVALADLDGDGSLDVIVASEREHNLTVLLGDGRGGFRTAPGSPFGAGHAPNDIAVARFDGDAHLDIAVANHETDTLTVLFGDGRGGFGGQPPVTVRVGVKPHPHGIAAADFDGDGFVDVVTDGWETDEVEVLRGDGRGGFALLGRHRVGRHPYQRVRARDVNGDRHADIVTANLRGAGVTILLGDGRGGFRQADGSPFPANPFPTALTFGNFDGDQFLDIAVANSPSNSAGQGRDGLTVLLGRGGGRFERTGGGPLATGRAPTQLAAGDFDADGRDEIAVSNMNSGTVSVVRLSPARQPAMVAHLAVGELPKGIAAGDLDGDDRADLVVALHGRDEIVVLLSR